MDAGLDALDGGRHEEGGQKEAVHEGAQEGQAPEVVGADAVEEAARQCGPGPLGASCCGAVARQRRALGELSLGAKVQDAQRDVEYLVEVNIGIRQDDQRVRHVAHDQLAGPQKRVDQQDDAVDRLRLHDPSLGELTLEHTEFVL